MDDLLIFGTTEKEHDENLEMVKNILKAYGLEINESKSEYKKKEIEFLGHIIKENTIEKQMDDKEAIKDYPIPRNVNELQRFFRTGKLL